MLIKLTAKQRKEMTHVLHQHPLDPVLDSSKIKVRTAHPVNIGVLDCVVSELLEWVLTGHGDKLWLLQLYGCHCLLIGCHVGNGLIHGQTLSVSHCNTFYLVGPNHSWDLWLKNTILTWAKHVKQSKKTYSMSFNNKSHEICIYDINGAISFHFINLTVAMTKTD